MLHVQCNGCGTSAYVDCVPGCDAVTGGHLAGCPSADPDAMVTCPPGSGCCEEDHHHGKAAAACPGEHDGPCEQANEDCTVCRPLTITVIPGSVQLTHANLAGV